LVEHATENRSVGGSIPPLGTSSLSWRYLSSKIIWLQPKRLTSRRAEKHDLSWQYGYAMRSART
jgi:hypothetical protein